MPNNIDFKDVDALTFDCYGTLIDWEAGLSAAFRAVLDAHGVAHDPEDVLVRFARYEAASEGGTYRTYREILTQGLQGVARELGFEPTPAEMERFSRSVEDWPAFPDSTEALRRLKRRFRLGVLTNCDDDLFAASNHRLAVEFDWVITAQQVGSYKPNEHNFEVMLDRLGLPQERIVHVAQSLFHDHAPAKRLGFTTVWINRRHDRPGSGATPPAEAQPDATYPDMASFAEAAVPD
ncbi:MAG TPA: haloacid dehalogenase type II [Candidatus Limnocylindrales bacterium]|nr:haloacid dehalogenase type II [Candidatus Limnocylindrales bacterium]